MIRQPIVAVLAHVDHGKTTLLDKIRQSAIAAGEEGGITQEIGATVIPRATIEGICGEQLKKRGIKLTIPGLLFIDTPGHEAFTTLRRRGGSIADIAVLLVDINEGVKPQTIESIEILRGYKVPFVVAANKIDRLAGWHSVDNAPFAEALEAQREETRQDLDKRLYGLVGKLFEHGFSSERFDRIDDFTKQVAIVPTSGKTGEGIPELLMFIAGLTQKYMEKQLDTGNAAAKGTVLEVKDVQGLGTTIDAIIYEGTLHVGDTIVVGGKNGPIVVKVRALLQPKPLQEIRDPRKNFGHVQSVSASAGVKINAPGLEEAMAGSSICAAAEGEVEAAKEKIANELEEATIHKEHVGVVVKTDAIGSLEALVRLFDGHGIPIKSASVGHVTRKDVMEAEAVRNKDRYLGVVFAFNTPVLAEAEEEARDLEIPVLSSGVIYHLTEEYDKWKEAERVREKEESLKGALYPAKLRILPGYVFRSSKPAIFGVEIVEGILKPQVPLMNQHGKRCGKVKEIQKDKENVDHADAGEQVAIAVTGVTIGRQVNEGDILLTNIPLKEIPTLLREVKEVSLLEEIKKIKKEAKEEERTNKEV